MLAAVEPVRWGLLSTARINAALIPGLQESADSELVAVASRTQERAEEYASEWEIGTAHGSYDALLADPEIEAVYISLPNGQHVDWSVRALEAGKHVLCEKPLSRHPSEVERAFDVADAADRLLMEAFMWRHHPQSKRLAELVRDGAIGELRLMRASFSFPLGDPDDIRLDAALEGGALMDVGCYCVSGSRLIAGEPVTASAHQIAAPKGVDARLVGTLVFPGGVLGQIDCALDLPDRQRFEIVGSTGSLRVAMPWAIDVPGIELVRGDEVELIEIEPLNRYRLQTDNFSRAVRGVEPPLLGRDDALGQARTIDALYRSAELGGTPVAV